MEETNEAPEMKWIKFEVCVGIEPNKALCSVHLSDDLNNGHLRTNPVHMTTEDIGYLCGQTIKDFVASNRSVFQEHLHPMWKDVDAALEASEQK